MYTCLCLYIYTHRICALYMDPLHIDLYVYVYIYQEYPLNNAYTHPYVHKGKTLRRHAMDDFLDLLTYDCPVTGKKRCAVSLPGPDETSKKVKTRCCTSCKSLSRKFHHCHFDFPKPHSSYIYRRPTLLSLPCMAPTLASSEDTVANRTTRTWPCSTSFYIS